MMYRARLPKPMDPKVIRLEGATAPFKPNAAPGMKVGRATAAVVRFRNDRRDREEGERFMVMTWF
jgi:hypothetical protein